MNLATCANENVHFLPRRHTGKNRFSILAYIGINSEMLLHVRFMLCDVENNSLRKVFKAKWQHNKLEVICFSELSNRLERSKLISKMLFSVIFFRTHCLLDPLTVCKIHIIRQFFPANRNTFANKLNVWKWNERLIITQHYVALCCSNNSFSKWVCAQTGNSLAFFKNVSLNTNKILIKLKVK